MRIHTGSAPPRYLAANAGFIVGADWFLAMNGSVARSSGRSSAYRSLRVLAGIAVAAHPPPELVGGMFRYEVVVHGDDGPAGARRWTRDGSRTTTSGFGDWVPPRP